MVCEADSDDAQGKGACEEVLAGGKDWNYGWIDVISSIVLVRSSGMRESDVCFQVP